jgi:CheY-like chemotaxis protein
MSTGTQSKTILIIDDSTFDRTILSKVVSKKIACKIVEASGSEDAFRILESQTVDLILLDVEMPNMSGDEMITKFASLEPPKNYPSSW